MQWRAGRRGWGVAILVVLCLGVGHGEEGQRSGPRGPQEGRGISARVLALRGGSAVGRVPLPADDSQLSRWPGARSPTPPPPTMSLAAMPDRPRSSLVLPSVTKRGSLTDVVGWLVAMLTCSIKARKQMLLDQQLFMAAALGETELCLSLIDDGADVLAETDDGGDDPRYAFAELYGLQFYEEAEKAQALESVGKVRDPRETKAPSLKPPKRQAAARSALRWAAYNGHVETVQALIRRGCLRV
jgi:hypothetical protein